MERDDLLHPRTDKEGDSASRKTGKSAGEVSHETMVHERNPDGLSEADLNGIVEHICNSKAEEFRMLGYEQVTGQDIWECVSDKYHKTGVPPLHRVVNDILSLKTTQFMNWMTMSIYKDRSI
jgi:hypothetical protein